MEARKRNNTEDLNNNTKKMCDESLEKPKHMQIANLEGANMEDDKLNHTNLDNNNLQITEDTNLRNSKFGTTSQLESSGLNETSSTINTLETSSLPPGKTIHQVVKLFETDQISSESQYDKFGEPQRLSRRIFKSLLVETEDLKDTNVMSSLNVQTLVRFLSIMEVHIRACEEIQKLDITKQNKAIEKQNKTISKKINMSTHACVICLNILISEGMSKRIYLDEVIDAVINHVINQIKNIEHNKSIKYLKDKLLVCLEYLCGLLKTQILQKLQVIKLFSACVTAIFTSENVDWFLEVGFELVTTIFDLYKNLRKTFWAIILQPISKQSVSSCLSEPGLQKSNLESQKLSAESGDEIHTFTLLIVNLLQGLSIYQDDRGSKLGELEYYKKYQEIVVETEYFVKVFLHTCIAGETKDYFQKDILEMVLKDILELISKPECPISGLVLNFLGKHLTKFLVEEDFDLPVLLDLLNLVTDIAVKLVRRPIILKEKEDTIQMLLEEIRISQQIGSDIENSDFGNERHITIGNTSKCDSSTEDAREGDGSPVRKNIMHEPDQDNIKILKNLDEEEGKSYLLRRTMLDLFGPKNHSSAKLFYLLQWFHEIFEELPKTEPKPLFAIPVQQRMLRSKRGKIKTIREVKNEIATKTENVTKIERAAQNKRLLALEGIKVFLLKSLMPSEFSRDSFLSLIDLKKAREILEGVAFYLATEKCSIDKCAKQKCETQIENTRIPNFYNCLKAILEVTLETSIALRVKAIKSLTMLIHADSSLLEMDDVKKHIDLAISDEASSMREAALDLIGKYVLDNNGLFNKYFPMFLKRLSDSGPGLKKKILKIFIDVARRNPENIVEMGLSILPKIHDEEGVQKLALEFFEYLLYSASESDDVQIRLRMLLEIAGFRHDSFEDFQEVVKRLCNTRGQNFSKVCSKLIHHIFKIANSAQERVSGTTAPTNELKGGYFAILYSFAKAKPNLLVKYFQELEHSLKVTDENDKLIYTIKILEVIVGESHCNKSQKKMYEKLEQVLFDLIYETGSKYIMETCMKCLAAIINQVTRNYDVVRKHFILFHNFSKGVLEKALKENEAYKDDKYYHFLCRALFVTGLMLRHFDFEHPDISHDLQTPQKVFKIMMFFLRYESSKTSKRVGKNSQIENDSKLKRNKIGMINEIEKNFQNCKTNDDFKNIDIKTHVLNALGSICVRHDRFMLDDALNLFYKQTLKSGDREIKFNVLQNIESFLIENERRMLEDDGKWGSKSKHVSLKEMEDPTHGKASHVIQSYLTEILESYLEENFGIRKVVSVIVQLVVRQGLVYPVQIIPHLVAMATDEEVISRCAIKYLFELDMKFSSFIQTKACAGFLMSFKLHTILAKNQVARGYFSEGTKKAKNEVVYTILSKNCRQRRALILNMLKQFDDVGNSLNFKIYLADNLSKFPYKAQDEVLFLIYHITTSLLILGTNILQSLKKIFEPNECEIVGIRSGDPNPESKDKTMKKQVVKTSKRNKELEGTLKNVIPKNKLQLEKYLQSAQGCVLLWKLKSYLQRSYDGITDAKIRQYSPLENNKVYDKGASRKNNSDFQIKDVLKKIKDANFVKQYLDFKSFMSDLVDDSDIEEYSQNSGGNSDNAENVINPSSVVENSEIKNAAIENSLTEYSAVENSDGENSAAENSAAENSVAENSVNPIGENSINVDNSKENPTCPSQPSQKNIDKVKQIFFTRGIAERVKNNIRKYISASPDLI